MSEKNIIVVNGQEQEVSMTREGIYDYAARIGGTIIVDATGRYVITPKKATKG